MNFNKAYVFFLIITTVGAFFTIKICSAAYDAFSVDPAVPVGVSHHSSVIIQQPGADGLED